MAEAAIIGRGAGALQYQFDSVVIDNIDLLQVSPDKGCPLANFFGAFDGKFNGLSVERCAVVKLNTLPQGKGVRQPVLGCRESCRQNITEHFLTPWRVDLDQGFIHVGHVLHFRGIGNTGVQRGDVVGRRIDHVLLHGTCRNGHKGHGQD